MFAFCRRQEKLLRQRVVPRQRSEIQIGFAQRNKHFRRAMRRSAAEILVGLFFIARHAAPFQIHPAKQSLAHGVFLLDGLAEPCQRLFVVVLHAFAIQIQPPHQHLRQRHVVPGSQVCPLARLHVVARHPDAFVIAARQLRLRFGQFLLRRLLQVFHATGDVAPRRRAMQIDFCRRQSGVRIFLRR